MKPPADGRDAPGPEHPPVWHRGQSPVPAALLLAVIPLLLFGPVAVSAPPPPIPIKPVQTEGVRLIAMDTRTFSARWRPLYDMPPATVIHEVRGGDAQPREDASKPVEVARLPPARIVRRAALRTDICSKHGMRRVTYSVRGYQHWRCRR